MSAGPNDTVADVVAGAIAQAERPIAWVAREATTGELAQVAAALGVRPSSLLPPPQA